MSSKCCNRLSQSTALNFVWGLCYSLGTASSNALALHDFQSRPEGILRTVFDTHIERTNSILIAIFLLAIPTFVVYQTGRVIGMQRGKLTNLQQQIDDLNKNLQQGGEVGNAGWTYTSPDPTPSVTENLADSTRYGSFYCMSAQTYYRTTLVFGWVSVVAVGLVFFGGNALTIAAGIKAAGGDDKTAGSISFILGLVSGLAGAIGFYFFNIPQTKHRTAQQLMLKDGTTTYEKHPWIHRVLNPQQAVAYAARAFFSTLVFFFWLMEIGILSQTNDNLLIGAWIFGFFNLITSGFTALNTRGSNFIRLYEKWNQDEAVLQTKNIRQAHPYLLGAFLVLCVPFAVMMIPAATEMSYSVVDKFYAYILKEKLHQHPLAAAITAGASLYFTVYKLGFDIIAYNIIKTVNDWDKYLALKQKVTTAKNNFITDTASKLDKDFKQTLIKEHGFAPELFPEAATAPLLRAGQAN